jgi:hypothetical protein
LIALKHGKNPAMQETLKLEQRRLGLLPELCGPVGQQRFKLFLPECVSED